MPLTDRLLAMINLVKSASFKLVDDVAKVKKISWPELAARASIGGRL